MDFKGYIFLAMFWISNAIYTLRWGIAYYGIIFLVSLFWEVSILAYTLPLYIFGGLSSVLFLSVLFVANLSGTFETLTGIGSKTKTTITMENGEIKVHQEEY